MKNQPDKIYAYIPQDDIVGTASTKKGVPHQYVDIEYVRKDALLKKIEFWLNKRHKHDRYTLIYLRKHFKDIINEIMED